MSDSRVNMLVAAFGSSLFDVFQWILEVNRMLCDKDNFVNGLCCFVLFSSVSKLSKLKTSSNALRLCKRSNFNTIDLARTRIRGGRVDRDE